MRGSGIIRLAVISTATFTAWLTPAASAGVITFASSDLTLPHTGDVYQVQYGYNKSSLGTGVGYGTFNNLSGCTLESWTCSGSGMGTLDTSGLLTASYDQASASALGNGGATFTSSAYAVADLASGSVGVAASGTLIPMSAATEFPTHRRTTGSIFLSPAQGRAMSRI
jgi:hypothetical protein